MHAYRTHNCGQLRRTDVGSRVRLSGWVHRCPRPWRPAVHRFARPLRPHPMRGGAGQPGLCRGLRGALGMGADADRAGRRPHRRHHQSGPADRRDRASHRRGGDPEPRRGIAAAGVRRSRLPRRDAAALPVPGLAPRAAAPQHRAAVQCRAIHPPADGGRRLHRISDADPDRVQPRRRARLPGALAAASGQVLRAAPGAAAIQAAHHGGGLRPLFPDRALFPRRGRPRRPQPRRVLSARRRNELRHAGRCVRGHRAGAAWRVRGVR